MPGVAAKTNATTWLFVFVCETESGTTLNYPCFCATTIHVYVMISKSRSHFLCNDQKDAGDVHANPHAHMGLQTSRLYDLFFDMVES